jgi:hypothetical protein
LVPLIQRGDVAIQPGWRDWIASPLARNVRLEDGTFYTDFHI